MSRGLTLVMGGHFSEPGRFATASGRLMVIHGLRSGLLVAVFGFALVFQLLQQGFLSPSIWMPVYAVLTVLFLCNSLYFLFSDWCEDKPLVHGTLLALDALAITMLVHYTGTSQSIFFFLYLVDIILAGLVFERRGAFTQALWTSLLFGILLLFAPQTSRDNVYFLATLNNLAFFSVAYLSGNLSEQISFVGSELKRTAKSLEILQDLNRLIVENVGTGLMTVGPDNRIATANQAASRILDGLELKGRDINEVFPSLKIGGNLVWLRDHDNKLQRQDVEFVNRTRDRLQIEVSISPLRDERGRDQGYIVLFQDRTEIRRLELAMRQKEKLAAVGQLAAGIAHEIRNPLASLSGSVQLMISQPEKYAAEDLKLMRIITREIDRLNDLISEFLEYVRPENRPDQTVDVNKVLREVLEMVRFNSNVRKDIEYRAELKAKTGVLGSSDKLKQAFLNIIINACQAMEKTSQPTLEIETFDVQDRMVVVIRDNGVGMDEVTASRLFEPFYTTKPKGTGLGLAITHKILESHEANVNVSSQPGEGATFAIDFPAIRETYEPGPKVRHA